MAKNGKAKGKAGELEWVHLLKRFGWANARRSQQYCGANHDADVVGVPGLHFEVKRVEALNLQAAMQQAINDAGDAFPVVAHRRNRSPWLVTMRAEDFLAIMSACDAIE